MIAINIDPVAFSVGAFHVRWYGIMYVVGITVGLLVAWPFARSKGLTDSQLEKVVAYSIPAGFVGARLYYVLQQPLGQYISEPWRIFAVWEGGMAFYGAIFAVLIVVFILSRRLHISALRFLDVGAIFAVVGQFFGRIGNIINGDVIGFPTTLPWGMVYANHDSFPASHSVAYQPAAVYEALLDVVLFAFLWRMRNRVQTGMLFFLYVIGYSLGQIVIFVWRDNEVVALGLKQAQLTAIAVIVAAIAAFLWFRRRRQHQDGAAAGKG